MRGSIVAKILVVLWFVVSSLVPVPASASKLSRLTEAEYAHYRALRVFMDDDQRSEWLKLKTTEERDAWLHEHNLWDRFYSHPAEVRQQIVEGDVELGWSRDMVYMAWGPPFQKQRLTGREASRSELLVYRFELDKEGVASPLVGKHADYQAVGSHQTELIMDDDVVAEMKEKDHFE
ncbi:MAG: hypothetical protein ABMB14_37410 [Myxococcota bacterium]